MRGILAKKQQFAAAVFLLHTHRLIHGSAVIGQHILLRHYHQPETLLSARRALQEPAAVEPKEKKDLLSACCLRAGVCPVLVTPAGESFQVKLKQNGQLLAEFNLVFSASRQPQSVGCDASLSTESIFPLAKSTSQ